MDTTEFQSEELKGNETLKSFESTEALAQAHVDLAASSSKPWLEKLPEEVRTDENLEILKDLETPEAAANAIIGMRKKSAESGAVPAKAEDYDLPVDEGDEKGKVLIPKLKDAFFKHGAPSGLVDDLKGIIAEIGEETEVEAKAKAAESLESLQKAWPGYTSAGKTNLEVNTETANVAIGRVCQKLGIDVETDPDFLALKGNPVMARIGHWVGTTISEGAFGPGPGLESKEDDTIEDELEKEGFPKEK